MAWSDLDYKVQFKVIDEINRASQLEMNWQISNGLKAAAQELEAWSNNYYYGVEDKKIIENFIETGEQPRVKTKNRATTFWIVGLLSIIGAICGGQLTDGNTITTLCGSLVGGVLFATFGFFVAKIK